MPKLNQVQARVVSAIILIACLGLYVYRQYHPSKGRPEHTIMFSVFNTVCSINIQEEGEFSEIQSELISRLQLLHDCVNCYDPASELSRLNNSAANEAFICSDLLWDCLQKGREAHELTDGAFDITVGPLMKLWGFHGKRETIPSEQEISQALQAVGLDKVIFDDDAHSVRFAVPDMYLDFGGIAKGYACDLAADFLHAHGINDFLLDFGGNLRISGRKAYIGIRDPNGDGFLCTPILKDTTVATSGNYERSRVIDGRRVGHIMDARTGRPGEFFLSVSAITPKGYYADALSTAVFVGGEQLARQVIATLPGTSFIVVREDGTQEDWK